MLTTSTGRRRSVLAIVVAASGAALLPHPAAAQNTGCTDLTSHLTERKTIAGRLSAGGKKQIDAKVACSGFTQLVANGNKLIKWTEANQAWCQIPDSFLASVKADHTKALSIRSRACSVAAKQTQMEQQGASGGGGGGLLGGDGLSGPTRLPQGAL